MHLYGAPAPTGFERTGAVAPGDDGLQYTVAVTGHLAVEAVSEQLVLVVLGVCVQAVLVLVGFVRGGQSQVLHSGQ